MTKPSMPRIRYPRLPGFRETLASIKKMPDGPDKEEMLARLLDIKETEAVLRDLQKAIRDKKKADAAGN